MQVGLGVGFRELMPTWTDRVSLDLSTAFTVALWEVKHAMVFCRAGYRDWPKCVNRAGRANTDQKVK